jgi:hypothetical protein
MDSITREATEIELHLNNIDRGQFLPKEVMETSYLLPERLQ